MPTIELKIEIKINQNFVCGEKVDWLENDLLLFLEWNKNVSIQLRALIHMANNWNTLNLFLFCLFICLYWIQFIISHLYQSTESIEMELKTIIIYSTRLDFNDKKILNISQQTYFKTIIDS